MTIPSQDILIKYLIVMRQAVLHARALAWQKKSHEEIADLLDAIHNVPDMLIQWENCDENFLKERIDSYDKKWATEESFSINKSVNFYYKNQSPREGDSPLL